MPSVLILGAGLAGLTTARTLVSQNFQVTVLDKGRGVGGRMATRRTANGRTDHGAQYFSAKTPDFQQEVAKWQKAGVVREWHLETATVGDTHFDHPRYVGADGMNNIAKYLAEGLAVQTGERATQLRPTATGWAVDTESGRTFQADAICCTLPAPQALTLLADSALDPATIGATDLTTIKYLPSIAVIAELKTTSRIPAPGAIQFAEGPVAWVADNQQKGISAGPSVTIHASAEFSEARLEYQEADAQALGMELITALREWLNPDDIAAYQVHRWRYSLAHSRFPAPFLSATTSAPLLFGGDGFGMGNIEGAFTSGRAMAQRIHDLIR